MPVGTAVARAGFIGLAAAVRLSLALLRAPALLRNPGWASLLLVFARGLVSYLSAANWHCSFSAAAAGFRGSTAASVWFWRYSIFAGMFPLLLLVVALVRRIRRGCNRG